MSSGWDEIWKNMPANPMTKKDGKYVIVEWIQQVKDEGDQIQSELVYQKKINEAHIELIFDIHRELDKLDKNLTKMGL